MQSDKPFAEYELLLRRIFEDCNSIVAMYPEPERSGYFASVAEIVESHIAVLRQPPN